MPINTCQSYPENALYEDANRRTIDTIDTIDTMDTCYT